MSKNVVVVADNFHRHTHIVGTRTRRVRCRDVLTKHLSENHKLSIEKVCRVEGEAPPNNNIFNKLFISNETESYFQSSRKR